MDELFSDTSSVPLHRNWHVKPYTGPLGQAERDYERKLQEERRRETALLLERVKELAKDDWEYFPPSLMYEWSVVLLCVLDRTSGTLLTITDYESLGSVYLFRSPIPGVHLASLIRFAYRQTMSSGIRPTEGDLVLYLDRLINHTHVDEVLTMVTMEVIF